MIRRLLVIAELAAASALVPLAIWMTVFGYPDPGLVVSEREARVVSVFPGGPSWRDGLRAGQSLVELDSGHDRTGWQVVARDGDVLVSSSYAAQSGRVRDASAVALAAAAIAAAALVALRRVSIASALASLSIVAAAFALYPSGHALLTSAAGVAALLAPAAWLIGWRVRGAPARSLVGSSVVAIAAAWVVSRHAAPELFALTDAARQASVAGLTLSTVILLGDWRRLARRLIDAPGTWADVAAAAVIIALAAAVVIVFELPVLVMAGLLAPALLLYPRFRALLTSTVDRVVLGEVRDRASIQAVEDERSRIARDIHDAPLQEIAAVIRGLDGRPGTEREVELLRSVADHLRGLTTELRPPILDDLGLAAAIAYVADQAAATAHGIDVQLRLEPEAPAVDRPPPDIELAVFRIVQESVDNAVRHAGATAIAIEATIDASRVRASVTDDGRGIPDASARRAIREGHFGLVSMSQRAALIGADLRVEPARPHGTRVTVEWGSDR